MDAFEILLVNVFTPDVYNKIDAISLELVS